MRDHIEFRVHPGKGKWYYRVFVFRNRTLMLEFSRRVWKEEFYGGRHDDVFMARFYSKSVWYRRPKRHKKSLGMVLFYRQYMPQHVRAHEMIHAAVDYFGDWRFRKIPSSIRVEESFAYSVDGMVKEMNLKYNPEIWTSSKRS